MNKVQSRLAWAGCAVAVAMLLSACRSATTRIYGLQSTHPATRIDEYRAPAVRVDTLNVPASWDRIEIVTAFATGAQQINEFDHWSAPLPQLARQVLSDDLDQRLPPGNVIYPRLPKPDGALGLDVDILEFAILGSRASMRASWVILPSAAGSQSAKRSVASLQTSIASTQPAAIVQAWSDLIGQLADRIAADVASFSVP